jgi:hypothetical protein
VRLAPILLKDAQIRQGKSCRVSLKKKQVKRTGVITGALKNQAAFFKVIMVEHSAQ